DAGVQRWTKKSLVQLVDRVLDGSVHAVDDPDDVLPQLEPDFSLPCGDVACVLGVLAEHAARSGSGHASPHPCSVPVPGAPTLDMDRPTSRLKHPTIRAPWRRCRTSTGLQPVERRFASPTHSHGLDRWIRASRSGGSVRTWPHASRPCRALRPPAESRPSTGTPLAPRWRRDRAPRVDGTPAGVGCSLR